MLLDSTHLISHLLGEGLYEFREEVNTLGLEFVVLSDGDSSPYQGDSGVHQARQDGEQEVLVSSVVHCVHVADKSREHSEYGEDASTCSRPKCLRLEELDKPGEEDRCYCVNLKLVTMTTRQIEVIKQII